VTSVVTLGNLTIDRERFDVWIGDRRIELTFVEFELLYQLARHTERVMPRARLIQAVWNEPASRDDQKLTVHMSRLRKKLRGSQPWRIETVTKRGYVLTESPDDVRQRDDAPALEQRRAPRVGGLA
jgi:DNA-binding response OmpR family regulator